MYVIFVIAIISGVFVIAIISGVFVIAIISGVFVIAIISGVFVIAIISGVILIRQSGSSCLRTPTLAATLPSSSGRGTSDHTI
jgi:hypothetical protein